MWFPKRQPDRPFANCYWVEPGRLLAGEYPGADTPEVTRQRLRQLLDAGIRTFIDLTREQEMEPYMPEFEALSGQVVRHFRFGIQDHSLPEHPRIVIAALDAIDAALERGEGVYVHCRAGIGRTGLTVAAYLMRRGLDNEQAFEHLQTLWQECGRARRWPVVPETDEQIEYVRRWQEPRAGRATSRSRVQGALVGLVLADAIASAVKSKQLDAQLDPATPLALPPVLPADGAQTLAVLESFLAHGNQHQPEDQMQRYLAWTRSVQQVPNLPVPDTLKRALSSWQWSHKPYAGTHDPRNLDAHSLSRSLAVALCHQQGAEQAIELAVDVCRTTQQSPLVLDVCRAFTACVLDALAGTPAETVAAGDGPHIAAFLRRAQRPEVRSVFDANASFRKRDSSAPAVLHCALRTLATSGFAEGMQRVAQLGAVNAAALFGGLSGACRGIEELPPYWRQSLPQQPLLLQLCERLPRS